MNDPPEGYKRDHPTGCQSLPIARRLKILGWGQDLLIRMEKGDRDLTKEDNSQASRGLRENSISLRCSHSMYFSASLPCFVVYIPWEQTSVGLVIPWARQALHSYMPVGLFTAWKLQTGFGVNDGDICCMCSYPCFIAQGQTNKCLL